MVRNYAKYCKHKNVTVFGIKLPFTLITHINNTHINLTLMTIFSMTILVY